MSDSMPRSVRLGGLAQVLALGALISQCPAASPPTVAPWFAPPEAFNSSLSAPVSAPAPAGGTRFGISCIDLDGDGWEDLLLNAGGNAPLTIFRNNRRGGLLPIDPGSKAPWEGEARGMLAWERDRHSHHVLITRQNLTAPRDASWEVHSLDLSLADRRFTLQPHQLLSSGLETGRALALADVDLDGRLDLFVGGSRQSAGSAEPASSQLYRGTPTGFALDSDNTSRLAKLGDVVGAIFTDINGDGRSDLILALRGGPIKLWINDHGRLLDSSASWGLDSTIGSWTCLASGDFNGDGRIDLVVGCEPDSEPAPPRPLSPDPTPIHTASNPSPPRVERESSIYLNSRTRFQPVALPESVQRTPARRIAVNDFNGDGLADVFVLYAQLPDQRTKSGEPTPPRGGLLFGTGDGHFRPTAADEVGLELPISFATAAVGDLDADGRVDWVGVPKPGTAWVFRNVLAPSGLRVQVRLASPDRWAVGATVRAVYAMGTLGPAWEVQSGGGQAAQDSPVLILGQRSALASIRVTWPGSEITTIKVPAQAREIEIDSRGVLRVIQ